MTRIRSEKQEAAGAIRSVLVPAFFVLFALAPVTASAQFDLLKRGQELLQGNTSGQGDTGLQSGLSTGEIATGLKEALRVGTERVVARLGAVDGFNADPAIHIPLPDQMKTVQETLGRLGMSGMLDDLETRLNRAAEAATPKARELFVDAISAMTIDDVRAIYNGPPDAATQYFKRSMTPGLREAFRPSVDAALAEAGAVQAYDAVMGEYRSVPFVPDVKADLTDHALDGALDGIFHYVAQEEAAIRADPAKRTTEILQRVFGG